LGGYHHLQDVTRRWEQEDKQRQLEQERLNRQAREEKNNLQYAVLRKVNALGGFEPTLRFPIWQTSTQWGESKEDSHTKYGRLNGMIVGPCVTILFFDFKVDRDCKYLGFWWSHDAYLEADGIRLPFVGHWNQGKLNWLTNEDGTAGGWGWNNPRRNEIYRCNLVFAGKLPATASRISLREVGGMATGYTFDNCQIDPPEQGHQYSSISEAVLRGKILGNHDPIEGIYEDSGRNSFRLGVFKNEKGLYSVIHLDNGKHRWWKDGEIKATLYPSATRGLFKADWTDETFYKNTSALVTFDGAVMKVHGNELPMDDGSEEMSFVKMFPTDADMAAADLASNMSKVFMLPRWSATNNWFHSDANHESVRVNGLIVGQNVTVLWLELKVDGNRDRLNYFATRNACLKVGDVRLPFIGHWENNERLQINLNADGTPIGWGWNNPEKGKSYFYNMVFAGKFPADMNPGRYVPISIEDSEGDVHGYTLTDIMVSPPTEGRRLSGISEMELRSRLFHGTDPIEGIYENVGRGALRLGVIARDNGQYFVIYLKNGKHRWWYEGEVKATLAPTSKSGVFKAEWTDEAFCKNTTALVRFNGALMEVLGNDMPLDDGCKEMTLAKMWPSQGTARDEEGESESSISGGSGFALKYGYLVTNHHVVDGATDIKVWRSGSDGELSSKGEVVYSNEEADIAIVKTEFSEENVPYKVKTEEIRTGSDIFSLGYPMTTTMGKELKMTSGVISAEKGFKDNESLYQISAAIQPGNSGGPLFDKSGTLVGIVASKHIGAENVNYAIKSSRLVQILKMKGYDRILPTGNTFFQRKIADKVSRLRKYVYRIECSIGGSLGTGDNHCIWYPKVRIPYSHKVNLDMGTYVWPGDLVVVRVVRKNNETMLEVGGKCLNGAWLKSNVYLLADGKKYPLRKVEGLPNVKPKENTPDDFIFRTFKAYFPPLPAETKTVDFIEPGNSDENPFEIKGVSLMGE
jgi:V8-like Glu-specific endopeptidase